MRSKSEKVIFFLIRLKKTRVRVAKLVSRAQSVLGRRDGQVPTALPSGLTKAPGSESAEKDPLASETHTLTHIWVHTPAHTYRLSLLHTSHTHEEWQDDQ